MAAALNFFHNLECCFTLLFSAGRNDTNDEVIELSSS